MHSRTDGCEREKSKNTRDPHLSANMQAYQELLCGKLKLHHQSLGTYNTVKAIAERRRACIELGILREQDKRNKCQRTITY